MESSSRRPAGSSHSFHRPAGGVDSYGKGLPALSIATVPLHCARRAAIVAVERNMI